MTNTLYIAGKGPSVYSMDWDTSIPILAVSGGIEVVPDAQHFVSLDKPMHFPDWLTGSTKIQKHVPINAFAARWKMYPNVRAWSYAEGSDPNFGPVGPIAVGPLPRNYSLLFAVQLAPRLGFTRLIFIGCDLLSNELGPIAGVMKMWHPIAQAAGIEWLNASPMSVLQEWMPDAERMALCGEAA